MSELDLLKMLIGIDEGLKIEEIASITGYELQEIEETVNNLIKRHILIKNHGQIMYNDPNLKIGKIVDRNAKIKLKLEDGTSKSIDNLKFEKGTYVLYKKTTKNNYEIKYDINAYKKYAAEVVIIDNKFYIEVDNKIIEIDTNLPVVEGSIVEYYLENDQIIVSKIIGHINQIDLEIAKIVTKYRVPIDFSLKAQEEQKNIPSQVTESDIQGLPDLRHTKYHTISIDGNDTKDRDDALLLVDKSDISYTYQVPISSTESYIKIGSAIHSEGIKRATSHYLADRVIPKYPPILSNGICSINEGIDRITRIYETTVDKKGNIIKYRQFPAVILSNKQMTYEKVDRLFNGDKDFHEYDEYKDELMTFREISSIYDKKNEERCELHFPSNEPKLLFDDNHNVIGIVAKEQTESMNIIKNMSVYTGITAYKKFKEVGATCICRCELPPQKKNIDEFIDSLTTVGLRIPKRDVYETRHIKEILDSLKDKPYYKVFSMRLIRCLSPAYYTTNNVGHFALGLTNEDDGYIQVTSPIRRNDSDNHEVAVQTIDNHQIQTESQKRELELKARHYSMIERIGVKLEREVTNLYIARYMTNFIGQEFEGQVLDFKKDGIRVLLPNNVEGMIKYNSIQGCINRDKKYIVKITHLNKEYVLKLGFNVKLVLDRTDEQKREIYFKLKQKTLNLTR